MPSPSSGRWWPGGWRLPYSAAGVPPDCGRWDDIPVGAMWGYARRYFGGPTPHSIPSLPVPLRKMLDLTQLKHQVISGGGAAAA
ncbi:hypothetical protein GCM10009576_076760 [Streptomyces rhizosphaericus]|uniref:Uncharacterized protein n=1 Tax=Streptomyces rhizosphaericus TaxID=114699 RepID=A0ABN1SLI7_9ACTN